jgi:tRNA-dihydrouridine synthase
MPPRLWLAPLRGFTDMAFRNVYTRHYQGFDVAIAPFVPSTPGGHLKPSALNGLLPANNTRLPVVPQIMSKVAQDFIDVALRLTDLGYREVNWNLGCPYPMVAKKGRGCGMLPYPDRIKNFLDDVVPKMPMRLSIKTRLGYRRNDELLKLLPLLNNYPIAYLMVHPRTGKQMYRGEINLDVFGECLKITSIPVIYNGGITSVAKFNELTARFGQVDEWMIGRGALMAPTLAEAIKAEGPFLSNGWAEGFRAFHDNLYAAYAAILSGPSHLLARMKGFWTYFAAQFDDPRRVAKRIHKLKRLENYRTTVEGIIDEAASRSRALRCLF